MLGVFVAALVLEFLPHPVDPAAEFGEVSPFSPFFHGPLELAHYSTEELRRGFRVQYYDPASEQSLAYELPDFEVFAPLL